MTEELGYRPPKGALGALVEGAREDCAARRRKRPGLGSELFRTRPATRGFARALLDPSIAGFPLICEVKRASPSVGALKPAARAPDQAMRYAEGGARAVSVLTEGRRFSGSLDDLRAVRQAIELPLLRKDFVVDLYMIYEALEAGADAVLLIAAAIEPSLLEELYAAARELSLDVLLELIYPRDLPAAQAIETPLVGVNARDLETLEVDPERFARLAPKLVRQGRLLVAESGIATPDDVRRVAAAGAGAALVGESLMRAKAPEAQVRALTRALEPAT